MRTHVALFTRKLDGEWRRLLREATRVDTATRTMVGGRVFAELLQEMAETGYVPTLRPDAGWSRTQRAHLLRLRAALHARSLRVWPPFGSYDVERS